MTIDKENWSFRRDAVPPGHTQFTVSDDHSGERVATAFRDEAIAYLITAAPKLLASIQQFFDATNSDEKHHAMVVMEESARMATGGNP